MAGTLISYPQHRGRQNGRGLHQRGADHVGQAKAGHAALLGRFQRVEHILGLAGLADEDAHILGADRGRVLGDELRRQHGDGGAARPVARSRPSPPTRRDNSCRSRSNTDDGPSSSARRNGATSGLRIQQVEQLAGHLWLLVDLLQHEVRIAALLHRVHRLGDRFRLRSIRLPSFTERTSTRSAHRVTISPSCGRITLRVSGRIEGRSDETQVKPSPMPDHHARAFLEGIQLVVIRAPDDEGIIAFQVAVGEADGIDHVVDRCRI